MHENISERELTLEQEMRNRGRDRFLANLSRLREQGNEGGTAYGKALLRRGVEPLAQAIQAFNAAAGAGAAGLPCHNVLFLLFISLTHFSCFYMLISM